MDSVWVEYSVGKDYLWKIVYLFKRCKCTAPWDNETTRKMWFHQKVIEEKVSYYILGSLTIPLIQYVIMQACLCILYFRSPQKLPRSFRKFISIVFISAKPSLNLTEECESKNLLVLLLFLFSPRFFKKRIWINNTCYGRAT